MGMGGEDSRQDGRQDGRQDSSADAMPVRLHTRRAEGHLGGQALSVEMQRYLRRTDPPTAPVAWWHDAALVATFTQHFGAELVAAVTQLETGQQRAQALARQLGQPLVGPLIRAKVRLAKLARRAAADAERRAEESA